MRDLAAANRRGGTKSDRASPRPPLRPVPPRPCPAGAGAGSRPGRCGPGCGPGAPGGGGGGRPGRGGPGLRGAGAGLGTPPGPAGPGSRAGAARGGTHPSRRRDPSSFLIDASCPKGPSPGWRGRSARLAPVSWSSSRLEGMRVIPGPTAARRRSAAASPAAVLARRRRGTGEPDAGGVARTRSPPGTAAAGRSHSLRVVTLWRSRLNHLQPALPLHLADGVRRTTREERPGRRRHGPGGGAAALPPMGP